MSKPEVAARTSDGEPTWTCPLCGWTTTAIDLNAAAQAHGVTEHPATFPAYFLFYTPESHR